MEEQLAALAAEVATLKDAAAALNRSTAEAFYYLTIPLMVLIHAGFLSYEMGASRAKNALAAGIKNILAFAFIIPTFYFAGWWIYWAFPTGLSLSAGPMGISGLEYANAAASPMGQAMGPNLGDSATGVFFGAFAMFAATTASIMSGRQLSDGRVLLVGNAGLLADSHDDGQTVELHWSPLGKGFAALIEVPGGVVLVGEAGVTPLDPAWLMSPRAPVEQ